MLTLWPELQSVQNPHPLVGFLASVPCSVGSCWGCTLALARHRDPLKHGPRRTALTPRAPFQLDSFRFPSIPLHVPSFCASFYNLSSSLLISRCAVLWRQPWNRASFPQLFLRGNPNEKILLTFSLSCHTAHPQMLTRDCSAIPDLLHSSTHTLVHAPFLLLAVLLNQQSPCWCGGI